MNIDGIKALLFDKDGTLLDYDKTWLPINREVALFAANGDLGLADELLAAGGHDPKTDRVAPNAPFASAGLDGLTDLLTRHLGPNRARPDLKRNIARIFTEGGAQHSTLLPHVRKTLLELSARGYVLGLATNDTATGLEASLAKHDVLNLFAFRCGCDSGHGAKPAPGMVQAFSASTHISMTAIAVIGDSVHDLAMAHAAGAGAAIAVLSGTGTQSDLSPEASLVIASVADLPALLPKRAP